MHSLRLICFQLLPGLRHCLKQAGTGAIPLSRQACIFLNRSSAYHLLQKYSRFWRGNLPDLRYLSLPESRTAGKWQTPPSSSGQATAGSPSRKALLTGQGRSALQQPLAVWKSPLLFPSWSLRQTKKLPCCSGFPRIFAQGVTAQGKSFWRVAPVHRRRE
ncbi:MAG: hypothetical protein BWX90_00031 [bacterium ADurb.Bin132]|nr:MAG: hypothetical protein BWX90_00031 [bacterium ADurb.Bin132]